MTDAVLNGLQPACDPTFTGGTGRFPQVSGLKITYTCTTLPPGRLDAGRHRALEGAGRAGGHAHADRSGRHRPDRHQRLHVHGGGDGYTALAGGTDVLQPGDALLEVSIEYITANSPVAPVVEGRIVGP